MTFRPLPTPRQAMLLCAFSASTALACAGLIMAAALAPAPPGVLPLVAATCIALPVLAAWDLAAAVAVLRAAAGDRRARSVRASRVLADFRRDLNRIPEAKHPLGG